VDKITMAERFDVGTMIDEVCSSKGNVKVGVVGVMREIKSKKLYALQI
jgi:hypothetical protein